MRIGRLRRLGVFVSAAVLALLIPLGGAAYAAGSDRTAARDIGRAASLVSKIPSSAFAPGRGSVLRLQARRAAGLARGKQTCAALMAADALLNALKTPSTWRKRRIPRASVRKPAALLASAEKRLVRKAGRRCVGQAKVKTGVRRQRGGVNLTALPRPAESHEQAAPQLLAPGTFRRPKSVGAPTSLTTGPLATPSSEHAGLAFAAAAPLSFFRITDLGPWTCQQPKGCGDPQEPTAAIGKNVVWYTGNVMDALSTDAGRTFTYWDPSSVLPDAGLPFCCDQVVSYSPKYNLFVWEMQYDCAPGTTNPATTDCLTAGTGANRIRIAFARPEDLHAYKDTPGKAWVYFDLRPPDFGQPANAWFDHSSLSVNDVNVDLQTDVARGKPGVGSLLARVSLSQLAAPGSHVSVSYIFDPRQRMDAAQGPGDISYFVGASSFSNDRILSWAPYGEYLFVHETTHSTVPVCDYRVNGTKGNDWRARESPGGPEDATVSGGTLYAAQSTGRAFVGKELCKDPSKPVFQEPAIFVAKYDVKTWKETGEKWIWHPSLAFAYPALATDGAGDVGIAYRAAANGQNPQPVASFFAPNGVSVLALPAGGPQYGGDFYSLRPGQTPHSFVMTALTVQGGVKHWDYIEYGRGAAPEAAPPDVSITSPTSGANFKQGATVTYAGIVHDPVWGALANDAIVWREDGNVIGHGPQTTHLEAAAGQHTITLTATNPDNQSASKSITINVQAPPPPGAPVPSIASPADSSVFCVPSGQTSVAVPFTATATDPNNPPQSLTYTWWDSINSGFALQTSHQLSPTIALSYDFAQSGRTTHDLTLSVTNTSGKTGSTTIRVYVAFPCLE